MISLFPSTLIHSQTPNFCGTVGGNLIAGVGNINASVPYYLKLYVSFLIVYTIMGMSLSAQPTFSKVFSNYPLDPENGWIITETQGNYILLSWSECAGQNIKSCCSISKINNEGNVSWFKEYPFHPGAPNTMIVHNNRIYIVGHTENEDKQFVLYCLDMEGNVVWNKEYGDISKDEEFPRVLLTNDNHFIICGTRSRQINNNNAPVLYFIETNIEGEIIAESLYGEQNTSSTPIEIIQTKQGNILTSYVYCPDMCFLDLKGGVLNMYTTDSIVWQSSFDYSFEPNNCLVTQIDSVSLVVVWQQDTVVPNYDLSPPALFYLNLSGQILGKYIFMNQSLKEITNIAPIWNEGLVGCGRNYIDYLTLSNPPLAGWVFRMNENKEIAWERNYRDTTYQGEPFGLQYITPTSDGGYIAVGTMNNNMTGVYESHNWILKLDSMGCLQPGCGEVNYITDTKEIVFLKGKDIKVYPNPTNNYLDVQFPINFPIKEELFVNLMSDMGSFIQRWKILSYSMRLDLVSVPSGAYYLVVSQSNEIIDSRKVIVNH